MRWAVQVLFEDKWFTLEVYHDKERAQAAIEKWLSIALTQVARSFFRVVKHANQST